MKLTAILILVACLQVSARGYTQESVTLNEKNADLASVLKKITKQTGVHFVHRDEWLKDAKPVNITVQNQDLTKVLQMLFQMQPGLTYERVSAEMVTVRQREEKKKEEEQVNDNNIIANPPIDVSGRVVNEKGDPVEGVTVTVKGTKTATSTNVNGEFLLNGIQSNAVLVFTSVNMETFEFEVSGKTDLVINLKTKVTALGGVTVTGNTGYQAIKPNEVTGSVVVVTKEQLDLRVAPDLISKLEGITSSLVFNKTVTGETQIRIRGESTIYANAEPLIIVDNFPYDGDLNNINPNDVESVTVLRDAAAASIWGVRAGNGVLVITTKRGKLNQPLRLSLSVNTTILDQPDLFYRPQLTSSEWIDVETFLFGKGFYNSSLSNPNLPALSPVVEILNRRKLGQITPADSASQIDAFRNLDYRDDYAKYIYQNIIRQQYHMGVNGGSNKVSYLFSAGFDKARMDRIGNENNRFTLSNFTTYMPLRKMEIRVGINYAESKTINNAVVPNNINPYTTLFDASGKELPVRQHRATFEDTIYNRGFYEWTYFPLQERNFRDFRNNNYDTRLTTGLKYSFPKGFAIEASYGYQRALSRSRNLVTADSYEIRDLINRFAIVNSSGNYAGTNYPMGGNLYVDNRDLVSHNGRGLLTYNYDLNNHSVSVLTGMEVRETKTEFAAYNFMGYNDDNGSFIIPIDTTYRAYLGNGTFTTSKLGVEAPVYQSSINRFRSFFANASYTFKDRYSIYGSARSDGSNYFGVTTNNKIVPLWSVGLKWDIKKENIINLNGLSNLSMRFTYGYSGNLDRSTAAVTTLIYSSNAPGTGLPWASILNVPNPELRWEKTGQINAAIDFSLQNNVLFGSIEYFHKKGKDLIGDQPMDPTLGIPQLRGNYSDMKTNGVDIQLQSRNLRGALQWSTVFNFSYAAEIVTRYDLPIGLAAYFSAQGVVAPKAGKPLYKIYSFQWAGLDPGTGNPRIYLGDTINKTYANSTFSSLDENDLIYHGRFNPTITGSLGNTFFWKGVSLNFNIIYKFNYYFRRPSVSYIRMLQDWREGHPDYALRWQKPGDEAFTNVPSFIYPFPSGNSIREDFYSRSNLLVEKGDHIRLQYVNLSYTIPEKNLKRIKMQGLKFFLYVNNVGILWKANKLGIDPEFINSDYPNPRSYSFGANVTL